MANKKALIEWGAATLALPGETRSGDLFLVEMTTAGMLVGVVDGLGHGDEAAIVAEHAVSTLKQYRDESVISLVKRCHESLAKTRGVVMTLAAFNAVDETMTWIGIGNVDARLFRKDAGATPAVESLLLRGGVVGYQLPPLRAFVIPMTRGDLITFATDGIQANFSQEIVPGDSPQQNADRILARCAKKTDDALVLVVRYAGPDPHSVS